MSYFCYFFLTVLLFLAELPPPPSDDIWSPEEFSNELFLMFLLIVPLGKSIISVSVAYP